MQSGFDETSLIQLSSKIGTKNREYRNMCFEFLGEFYLSGELHSKRRLNHAEGHAHVRTENQGRVVTIAF